MEKVSAVRFRPKPYLLYYKIVTDEMMLKNAKSYNEAYKVTWQSASTGDLRAIEVTESSLWVVMTTDQCGKLQAKLP